MTAEELATTIAPYIKKFVEAHTVGAEVIVNTEEFKNVPKIFHNAGVGACDVYSLLQCTMEIMDETFEIEKSSVLLEH